MSNRGAINAWKRLKHLPTIKQFCDDLGFKYEFIHGFEWHVRVENVMDIFPTRNRWHWLPTGERGGFKDYEELGQIFLERLKTDE